ncbi:universal stress protein [Methylococcus sp. Mc7]|uniref:universal stress protein n=1 Tax=Methylococcus sp. Mc7 TaxID=2860258 RepID=UPI001C52D9A1|nr:universal stress protein [Methylococcus sp. Mc7]QXP85723.1 universal stress protein [Methylococcus sp. Mc7]
MPMKSLRRILVATDFSGYANVAVRRAAMLAHRHCCMLDLLQVVGWLPLETLKRLIDDHALETGQHLVDSFRDRLKTLADLLRSHYSVTVDHGVRLGRPHLEINAHATDHHADLVVLGAHGEHFLQDGLLGTTTARVLRTGNHPVLIVRAEEPAPYRKILVPVDFSAASRGALAWALAIESQAAIHVLHAVEVPFEGSLRDAGVPEELTQRLRAEALDQARARLDEFIEKTAGAEAGRITRRVEYGYPPKVISDQSWLLRPDLIVVGKHGEAEKDAALLGSVTKHVIYEADCDVLVVADEAPASLGSNTHSPQT